MKDRVGQPERDVADARDRGNLRSAITLEMITPCSTMCQVSIHTLATTKNQNAQVGTTAGVMRQSGRMSA